MATIKDLSATVQLVDKLALTKAFTELKSYLDTKAGDTSAELTRIKNRINTLIGEDDSGTKIDVTTAIDTFNEIKEFLDGITDTTLQSLLTSLNTAVSTETTRAQGAETALGNRITAIENVQVMSAQDAQDMFDEIFNPTNNNG